MSGLFLLRCFAASMSIYVPKLLVLKQRGLMEPDMLGSR